jgi:hypothetical protein
MAAATAVAAVRKRRIRRGLRGWRSGELVFFIAVGFEVGLVYIAGMPWWRI